MSTMLRIGGATLALSMTIAPAMAQAPREVDVTNYPNRLADLLAANTSERN